MKRYIKEGYAIKATERAYNVIYKNQGYVPEESNEDNKEIENVEKEALDEKKSLDKIKKSELQDLLIEAGIYEVEEISKMTIGELRERVLMADLI